MPNDTNTSLVVTAYGTDIDFAAVPQASLVAMLRRGVSHYLGNEMSSKVAAFFDREENKASDTPEARSAKKAEFQAQAIEALRAGTVGTSVRGPAVDPIEKVIRQLAKAEVVKILTDNKLAFPKKDATIALNGVEFTGEALIDRRVAQHGERLRVEAAAEMKKREKEAAAKAKALASKTGEAGLADL